MLSEIFIAASSCPPKLTSSNSSLLKDAGIYIHSFQPQPGLRSTLKKSAIAPNCLAISESHIFAAQADKAIVHVYNRQKGNQEATIPFPERIRSIALAAQDTVLVIGTEGGSVMLWETCTGRQLATPQSHLQAVSALAVDSSSNYLLSGSDDSSILVWSLLDLLSFPPSSAIAQHEPISPRHTLASHRGAITALATGHSATWSNIAISASKDNTAIIWDYHTGTQLRTILLPATPLCLAVDPADRSFYVSFEDGSIQLVDFYAIVSSIHDFSHASAPIQSPRSAHWTPTIPDVGAALAINLSYDGTVLLSSHTSGKILSWDIASGSLRTTVAEYPGSPITNLQFLVPTGFPSEQAPRIKIGNVIKPKPHESFSSARGHISETYTINTHFPIALPRSSYSLSEPQSSFDLLLNTTILPPSCMASSIASLTAWTTSSESSSYAPSAPALAAADYLSLSLDGASTSPELHNPTQAVEAELAAMKLQIAHFRNLQKAMEKQAEKLAKENVAMKKTEALAEERRRRKMARRRLRAEKEWEDLSIVGLESRRKAAAMAMANAQALANGGSGAENSDGASMLKWANKEGDEEMGDVVVGSADDSASSTSSSSEEEQSDENF